MTRRRPALLLVALLVVLGGCSDGRGEPSAAPSVPEEELLGPVVYVSVGTDETDAAGLEDDDRPRGNWPKVLFRSALPLRAVHFNMASEGATVEDALDLQVPDALSIEPTIVTVWLTTGDVRAGTPLSAYERDLASVVRQLQQDGRAEVVLGMGAVVPDGGASADPYNEVVERVAEETGAELVDLTAIEFPMSMARHQEVADAFAAAAAVTDLSDVP